MELFLDHQLEDELNLVLSITGESPTSVALRGVKEYVDKFRDFKGEITPIAGKFIDTGKPCYILSGISVFAYPFCKVYADGEIKDVLASSVVETLY